MLIPARSWLLLISFLALQPCAYVCWAISIVAVTSDVGETRYWLFASYLGDIGCLGANSSRDDISLTLLSNIEVI